MLEDIRELIGPEKCFLMRGKRKTGKAGEGNTLIGEDYIGLIIQHRDSNGLVVGEDCLAISPMANRDAGYIVRHDASAGVSWRTVLSISRTEARTRFNARQLRFDPVGDSDKYAAYVEKAYLLLTCNVEQFGPDYRLQRRESGYRFTPRKRDMGKVGLETAALYEGESS